MSSDEANGLLLRQSSSNFTVINNTCLTTTTCSASFKYRTLNGTCNNLNLPNLGAANTVYRRLTTPAYSDGLFIIILCFPIEDTIYTNINLFVIIVIVLILKIKESNYRVWPATDLICPAPVLSVSSFRVIAINH